MTAAEIAEVLGIALSTTIPNLSASRLAALEVPHPPLVEQREIAAVLAHVRKAEATHNELRALSQDLKRATMEQVFRQGLSGVTQIDSPLGPVPDTWVIEELGVNHSVQTGGTPSRGNPTYWDGATIPWVKTAEVSYGKILETSEHITEKALAETNVKLFPAGTLLLAMYGQGVTRGKVARLGIDATCNQACAAIQSHGRKIDADYLFYFLEWQYESVRRRAHGGQQQNLSLDIVRRIPIAYPEDLAEQREIASLLGSIADKVELHRDRVGVVRELFQRLLRDLVTRDLRLADHLSQRPISLRATA
jgi:type I restriction enzyme, S subunit